MCLDIQILCTQCGSKSKILLYNPSCRRLQVYPFPQFKCNHINVGKALGFATVAVSIVDSLKDLSLCQPPLCLKPECPAIRIELTCRRPET